MPLKNYSVLRGRPTGCRLFSQNPRNPPHCHITMTGGFEVAVNIESTDKKHGNSDSRVLYIIDHGFTPDKEADLLALPQGLTALKSDGTGLALDFVRSRENGEAMLTRDRMSLLPLPPEQAQQRSRYRRNDLHNEVVDLVKRAVDDDDSNIFAFGDAYTSPDKGIHDIHMNQGNAIGDHSQDNGIYQDGGLLIHYPGQSWVAVFIAFQVQAWETDEKGNPSRAATAGS
ncbi:MAG TPA: YukJ family protein [Candidatus Angelobacter sp.]|nr:YukJ family protein [Candidatus Angelobacter sp.]